MLFLKVSFQIFVISLLLMGKLMFTGHGEQNKLEQLSKKMEKKFDSLKLTLDMLLENCYLVQMDESVLETKISNALNKLIDLFQE